MYVTYALISAVLILFGIVGSVLLSRFIKNRNLQNVTIPALSECLNTIFIGLFYLYCAVVMAQHLIPPPDQNNDTDIAIIEEETVTEFNATTVLPEKNQYPNQEFLLNYQNFLKNALQLKKMKQLQESEDMIPQEPTTNKQECFEDVFIKNSLFLYSFLHSAVSLILNTMECKPPCEKSTEKARQKLDFDKINLIVKILTIFLLPIICIVVLYSMLYKDMKMGEVSRLDPNIHSIIHTPINVTSTEKSQEVNEIIHNIYNIINETQISHKRYSNGLFQSRKPKDLKECPELTFTEKIYTLLVFLLYFIAIFCSKMNEMRQKGQDRKKARQLNVSIICFVVMWLFAIAEMFSKVYVADSGRYNTLTEIFISLGNINPVSIILMNYLTAKEAVKKYNLVEPQA